MSSDFQLATSLDCEALIGIEKPKKIKRIPGTNRKRRCTCTTCFTCLDNARWDRIFSKFVDPDYYTLKVGHYGGSTLSNNMMPVVEDEYPTERRRAVYKRRELVEDFPC